MYLIKFLSAIDTASKRGEPIKKYHTAKYDINELPIISQNWRTLGFIKIVGLEVVKAKPEDKLSRADVIELFYPKGKIDDEDIAIKNELLKSRKESKPEPENKGEASIQDDLKAYRKEMREKIEAKTGEAVRKNLSTQALEQMIKDLNI